MQDYILRNWSVVRTGTTAAQKALFFNLRRLRAKIGDGSGGPLDEAGRAFIASELSVNTDEVEAMEMRSPAATSRSTPRSARPARTSGRISSPMSGPRPKRP
jgi:RNA polymerase sigma-32 factor